MGYLPQNTATLLIDLHYLPSLEYFVFLLPYDTIRLEASEFYQKQRYRNRCYILTSQRVNRLTIPIRIGSGKMLYKNTEIDYSQPWENLHWRALCAAYGKAPYFEYFAEYFHALFLKKHAYLFDLNLELLQTCLQLLQLRKKIELSEHYEKEPQGNVVDARSSIRPSTHLGYCTDFHPIQYSQVFGQTFSPNLSIIDLLFCKGHDAYMILQKTRTGMSINLP